MSWYKIAKDENYDEMLAWFEKRTKMHIGLVQKYCKKLEDFSERFDGLVEQAKDHDASKFEDPEIDPYVYITWQYYCKEHDREFEAPKDMDEQMNKATMHHVLNNAHHPERHADKEVVQINRKDRDKPSEEIIDATKMPDLDIAEMCCDWASVSEEKGTSLKGWADKNVNIRWKFTDEQKDLIYELIEFLS